MLYGTECCAIKCPQGHKISAEKMRMLCWMSWHTRRDKIKNKSIGGKVGVASIEEKMVESSLK